ncbi:MAG TPA: hypothetical protein VNE62_06560 [Actinomycetota bacterium]|nr:hypothetical protein [Actinomycetota bacterium]
MLFTLTLVLISFQAEPSPTKAELVLFGETSKRVAVRRLDRRLPVPRLGGRTAGAVSFRVSHLTATRPPPAREESYPAQLIVIDPFYLAARAVGT